MTHKRKFVDRAPQRQGVWWWLHYDSMSDLRADEVPEQNQGVFNTTVLRINDQPSLGWWGVHGGCKGVEEALLNGWPQGTKKMREALGKVEVPALPTMRRKRTRGASGDFVDIHRVNTGQLATAWDRMERKQSLSHTRSHVTIAVDLTANGDMSAEQGVWRGVAAMAIADAAQRSGRQVRIIACDGTIGNCTQRSCNGLDISVTVKKYTEQIGLDMLAAIVALLGTYRLYFFKAITCTPETTTQPGLGRCIDFDKNLFGDASEMVWIGRNVTSQREAQVTVNTALKAMARRRMSA